MTEVLLLGRRAVREVIRYPEATIPTLFIPLFFLAVNIGQVSPTFPSSSTPFLNGQGYVAFQLPVSLMFAVATATTGLALVTEIDSGYFDKLLVAPVRRTSLILGRLGADLVRGIAASTVVVLAGFAFGAHIESGVLGTIVLMLLAALFGVAYAGFGILVALHDAERPGDQHQLPALLPAALPHPQLRALRPPLAGDGDTARINPVSYVIVGLRSLILDGWVVDKILVCLGVTLVDGRGLDRPVAARDRDLRQVGAATIRRRAGQPRADQGGQRALPRRGGRLLRLQVGDRFRRDRSGPGDGQAAQGARPVAGAGVRGRAGDRCGNRLLLAQPAAGRRDRAGDRHGHLAGDAGDAGGERVASSASR